MDLDTPPVAPVLSDDELRFAYRLATRSRSQDEHMVRVASRGEVPFGIWGPGEEVHGVATAMAMSKVISPERLGLVPHYRSGALNGCWAALHGRRDYSLAIWRQLFARDTDEMSRGRQMVYHVSMPELGILPVQSPVGMQLGKAAGYALGFKKRGIDDALTMAILGDGTTAEGDLHDAMNAASVWSLPLVVMVTDNGIAISTQPVEGRGIKDFAAYAQAFGAAHFSCDGGDFWDVYQTTWRALRLARDEQRPVVLHVVGMPRFNGHSSAADMTFDLNQADPLTAFAEALVGRGLLAPQDALVRVEGKGRDFFSHHRLGKVMEAEDAEVRAALEQARSEPLPPLDSIHDAVRPPFPQVQEPAPRGETVVTYGGAIRAALDHIIDRQGGVVTGQDVARLGGVMQATAGLARRHPDHVIDAPLNEPLIVGTACGMGLHSELVALPEIQFGDYSLNAFHWLVHMGNLYWSTHGQSSFATILRMPVDPFGGGAMYHSMSVDGYFSAIPGLVILMPSTSLDIYGLLLTAAEYRGPVVVLEPKWMYRQSLGPAIPGEPTDSQQVAGLRKHIMRGGIPELSPDVRVPFSQAAVRRAGSDLTIVAWGRAVWTCLESADVLAREGIEAEVIDLRTLVPPDLETVYSSVGRTGRLIVAAEDRPFAGFARSIQGHAVERFPGLPSRVLGQADVPGIAASLALEHAAVLGHEAVTEAARELVRSPAQAPSQGWSWVPPRYFLG